ncbi:nitrate- and nitrite sensing domain-containing protein [Streptomyces sp. NPDC002055]|uniref:sensor histidine kinase n=1 Tax=Streptomyces sp. NPDC002055 TaxID=3154534 RepID=UPI003325F162
MWPRGRDRGPKGTEGGGANPTPQRTARVRNRLVASVAVVGVAVIAAAAPGIAGPSHDLTESQRLVTLSELNGQAVALAHSLADERDVMTEFVAARRSNSSGAAAVSETRRARVDRQVTEIRPDAPADLRRVLDTLPELRQEALSGRGDALRTFTAYSEAVQALHGVSTDLARRTPPRATDGSTEALPALGRAVEQASATRALLLGALSGGGGQPQLTAAGQRARVQEQAALAEFDQTAPEAAADRYASTVNGTEVGTAEAYLARLTDQPRLSAQDVRLNRNRVDAALSARVDRMRAAESALTSTGTTQLAQLRDDDVTALEMRIALGVVCLLLAVGISMSAARSMTRPLSALRRGARRVAADPVAEEPVRYTGRNDEFAEVVAAVNELREAAARQHGRSEQLGDDRARLVAERQRLADQREELLGKQKELTELLAGIQDRIHGSHVNLALRTLGLVERQLGVIEGLEDREQEPERLDTLFKLDHLATRMRRYSENLLVLAGSEYGNGHSGPVPLLDVLRAAVSEIERYERVRIQSLPPHARIAGFAADAVSHLVAELLENATAFSPPDADVELSGWLMESGEVMLSVQDEGIGMTEERLAELNARLADPHPHDAAGATGEDHALGLGLYVVARLAARHGVRVQLRDQKQGGVAAVVVLPKSILPTRPAPAAAGGSASGKPGGTPAVSLPGSVAEANSNALPRRTAVLPAARSAADAGPQEPAAPAPDAQQSPEAPGGTVPEPAAVAPSGPDPDGAPTGETPLPDPLTLSPAAPQPSETERPAQEEPREPGAPSLALTSDDPLVAAAERAVAEAQSEPQPAGRTAPEAPYAAGSDEHARTEDEGTTGRLDQPTQSIRVPQQADPADAAQAAHAPAAGDASRDSGPRAAQWERVDGPAGATPAAEPVQDAAESAQQPSAEGEEPGERAPKWERVTDKGLPKRTPKTVAPTGPKRERKGSVDADALRRRLGGFQQGSRDGRRDAEAETVERTGQHQTGAQDDGGTVEEARG